MHLKIFCSAMESGTDPSVGLGVARSIRAAFPSAEIIGVDYSFRSTGLHDPVLDDIWVPGPWAAFDLDQYAHQIRGELASGAIWISNYDSEADWLGTAVGEMNGLLMPGPSARALAAKPADNLAERIGLARIPSLWDVHNDELVHMFCREHGWPIWLKTPYETRRADDWRALIRLRSELHEKWHIDDVLFEADVAGTEEAIVFAAFGGVLLGARHLEKRAVTGKGKTWAGSFGDLDVAAAGVTARLASALSDVGWTGGGEIELVRSPDGRTLWLLECNPRFPSWVYGATLCGSNLPGALVEAVSGIPAEPPQGQSTEFVRVVTEIPARRGLSLRYPPLTEAGTIETGRHPAQLDGLMRKALARRPLEAPPTRSFGMDGIAIPPDIATPRPLLTSPARRWREIAARVRAASGDVPVHVAYSVKTNPDRRLMSAAREAGFWAETISTAEVDLSVSCGFSSAETVLNGPGKLWPGTSGALPRVGTIFADSADELGELARHVAAGRLKVGYLGVRIRPESVRSRFGASLATLEEFQQLANAVAAVPRTTRFAVHLHLASSVWGHRRWRRAVTELAEAASALESLTDQPVRRVSLGGGWSPADFERVLVTELPGHIGYLRRMLPNLDSVLLEPGKALVQPHGLLVTSVLAARRTRGGQAELVLDASIADLPEVHSYPHRFMYYRDGWWTLPRGRDRILGRLCMESDILHSDIRVPPDIKVGERLVIADAGGYDHSMRYRFGRG
jgi:diaminopimelate decarboxylase